MNTTKLILGLSLCMLTGASACKTQQSTQETNTISGVPEWVNNPNREYSDARYLMAVGSGDSFENARSRAYGNLTQIFRSQIDGSQQLISEFTESSENNAAFTSNETTRLLNNIRIDATEELMNTEVLTSDVGTDGRYYVLVGMNRYSSLEVYTNEIQVNETRINTLTQGSGTQESVFRKLSLAKEALILAKVNDNLARQLEIISPGNFDRNQTTARVTEAESRFSEVQEQAVVSIDMNSHNAVLRDAVSKTIQEQGFSISDPENSVLQLSVNYNAQEANLNRDDAEFVTWNLSISISEPGMERSYQTFTTRGRDGALSLADAFKRAELTASKEIETKFSEFLNNQLSLHN